MAGSLNHIVDEQGRFRIDLLDSAKDRVEALEECFDIISVLCGGGTDNERMTRLADACVRAKAPIPGVVPRLGARARKET